MHDVDAAIRALSVYFAAKQNSEMIGGIAGPN
jgi:hypothetical protein